MLSLGRPAVLDEISCGSLRSPGDNRPSVGDQILLSVHVVELALLVALQKDAGRVLQSPDHDFSTHQSGRPELLQGIAVGAVSVFSAAGHPVRHAIVAEVENGNLLYRLVEVSKGCLVAVPQVEVLTH